MDQPTVQAHLSLTSRDEQRGWQPGDAYLAGGTWLMSEPQPGLRRLIDITGAGWPPLTATATGLEIAATCTIAQLAAAAGDPAPLLRSTGAAAATEPFTFPAAWTVSALVRECADALVASFKIWHLATVGGNVCLGLPAGSMTSLLTALDATALVWRRNGRDEVIPVVDLVTGYGRTALAPGDLVRSFMIGTAALTARTAFARMSLSDRGRSAALVIAREDTDGAVTVAITAATKRPYLFRFARLPSVRQYREATATGIGDDVVSDVHGGPDWRRQLVLLLGARALARLAGQEL